MHLGIAIDGEFSLAEYANLARRAENAKLDFVSLGDSGVADPVTVLAGIAPLTSAIGLLATVGTTFTEPYTVSKSIATLDHVSHGRAGWRVRVSADEVARYGRVPAADPLAEAAEFVEVVTRLWDSWEDGAEIRDRGTGRFLDRAKLHRLDHEGRYFSVRGPAVIPRPPQGRPVIVDGPGADMVFVKDFGSVGGRTILEVPVSFEDSARQLADDLIRWHGLVDGFHLLPATLPDTLDWFAGEVVPILMARGAFRTEYRGTHFRDRLVRSEAA
ncbi:Luciferase-like monooxygenase [Amycolatopsis xylanica]|uniref:Luciferase-like monooxygenase n=1 Tax=Amycolatopsis xylanica TaxID=589385 RepID=A0A1H3PK82_9PSEU|nr:LLM class flavin-dependent oxidoreductase [Amycolatopsis xylanica]SDZ01368.1 Luciferase-like monooxygenase [Amycolatopsis xylanica]